MNESEKKEYKALKYFIKTDRDVVVKERKKDSFKIEEDIIDKLSSKAYIDLREYNPSDHYHTDTLITEKGYKRYSDLRNLNFKYWKPKIITIILLLLFLNIYLLGRNLGWW